MADNLLSTRDRCFTSSSSNMSPKQVGKIQMTDAAKIITEESYHAILSILPSLQEIWSVAVPTWKARGPALDERQIAQICMLLYQSEGRLTSENQRKIPRSG